MYLAAAGVGKLILADDDVVELSNLQRQIAHSQDSIGVSKAESGKQRLLGINPDIEVVALNLRLAGADLDNAVEQADLVLDACDNFATRFAINESCIKHRTPFAWKAKLLFLIVHRRAVLATAAFIETAMVRIQVVQLTA